MKGFQEVHAAWEPFYIYAGRAVYLSYGLSYTVEYRQPVWNILIDRYDDLPLGGSDAETSILTSW